MCDYTKKSKTVVDGSGTGACVFIPAQFKTIVGGSGTRVCVITPTESKTVVDGSETYCKLAATRESC